MDFQQRRKLDWQELRNIDRENVTGDPMGQAREVINIMQNGDMPEVLDAKDRVRFLLELLQKLLATQQAARLQQAARPQEKTPPLKKTPPIMVECVRIAQDPFAPNAVCTARLRGVKQEFVFRGSSDHSIGFTRECAGMDYPAQPWPQGGSVNFSGPEIDAMFNSEHVSLECVEKGFSLRNRDGMTIISGFYGN